MSVEVIFVELVANIYRFTILQDGCEIAHSEADSIDENGRSCLTDASVGNVEFEVFACFSYSPSIAIVDEVAGNEDGTWVAWSVRFETLQDSEELLSDISEAYLGIYKRDGFFLMGLDMLTDVLLKALPECG